MIMKPLVCNEIWIKAYKNATSKQIDSSFPFEPIPVDMSEGYVVNMTTHANMLGVPTHDYEASSVQ
jgi:hypothetical protein